MIHVRNATYAQTQDFVRERRVAITYPEIIRSVQLAHYTLIEMLDIFGLCLLELSVAANSSSPVVPPIISTPSTAPDTSPKAGSSSGMPSVP